MQKYKKMKLLIQNNQYDIQTSNNSYGYYSLLYLISNKSNIFCIKMFCTIYKIGIFAVTF